MSSEYHFVIECQNKVFSGQALTDIEAKKLLNISKSELKTLSDAANKITRKFQGNTVDVEQLSNIKKNYFRKVCNIIEEINDKVGVSVECSLGFLTLYQANQLKKLGVKRYNHNLETARSKFPEICTTHTYQDRVNTLKIAREAGLELCTGGIIGMGETRKQRLELILDLAKLNPEEVTMNLLVPIPGTPLELQTPLPIDEILRTFAVIRFLLPKSIIKISGGREVNLDDDGEKLLLGGANGIISSGYLTLGGNEMKKDLEMIRKINLEA